jgi:hypothetical protein
MRVQTSCRLLLRLAAVGFISAAPCAARAANLLVNPGFDGTLGPWTVAAGDVSLGPLDIDGAASSNSALLRAAAGSQATLRQCVNLPPGVEALDASTALIVAPGQSQGHIILELFFFQQPDCALTVDFGARDLVLSTGTDWIRLGGPFAVPPGSASLDFSYIVQLNDTSGEFEVAVDDARLEPIAALTLNEGRFVVSADWATSDASGHADGVELTADSGYFWFFDPANVELIVKVLNGCGLNDRYWVFAGGLTNVKTTLHVLDTEKGIEATYVNPQDTAFQPIQDTNALDGCD